MVDNHFRNSEHYADPTAFEALKNIKEGEKKMEYHRGDIFYISKCLPTDGSEQEMERPGVIISNESGNLFGTTVIVALITSKEKKPLPVHVPVRCKVISTVLCEQVFTVSKERLTNFIRQCTAEEMAEIDRALKISFALDGQQERTEKHPAIVPDAPTNSNANNEALLRAEVERDLYKNLYQQLQEKILAKAI